MKQQFLFLTLMCSIFFYSCTKQGASIQQDSPSLKQERLSNKTSFDTVKAKQEHQDLILQFKNGQITFEQYRKSVKLLLHKFKEPLYRFRAAKEGLLKINLNSRGENCGSNPFSECNWAYTPSNCPFPPDIPEDCENYHCDDCMSQCDESYWYAGDVLMENEVAEEAKYQAALAECNDILDPGSRFACIYMAQYNYQIAMGTIMSGYFLASGYLDTCQENCPCY